MSPVFLSASENFLRRARKVFDMKVYTKVFSRFQKILTENKKMDFHNSSFCGKSFYKKFFKKCSLKYIAKISSYKNLFTVLEKHFHFLQWEVISSQFTRKKTISKNLCIKFSNSWFGKSFCFDLHPYQWKPTGVLLRVCNVGFLTKSFGKAQEFFDGNNEKRKFPEKSPMLHHWKYQFPKLLEKCLVLRCFISTTVCELVTPKTYLFFQNIVDICQREKS